MVSARWGTPNILAISLATYSLFSGDDREAAKISTAWIKKTEDHLINRENKLYNGSCFL
jgi:hypothetical protein